MDDRVWMYHETEEPTGRIFHVPNRKAMEELEADGWIDNPANFGKKKEKPSTDEPKPIAKMSVAELDDYIVQRGGVPDGSKADKVKQAIALPTKAATTAPADVADNEDGDGKNEPHDAPDGDPTDPKPVEAMTDDELRRELDEAEVNFADDASRDNLIAGVRALRGL